MLEGVVGPTVSYGSKERALNVKGSRRVEVLNTKCPRRSQGASVVDMLGNGESEQMWKRKK